MKNKKIIFFRVVIGLTAIVAIVAPVAAIVSCEGIKDDYEDEFTAKETENHSGLNIGGKSDNVWEVTLHKDSVSKEHLVKLLSDKLWLAVSKAFSIGYKINIIKDNQKILSFTVLAPKSNTYSALFLKDAIQDKLEEAIKATSSQKFFTN